MSLGLASPVKRRWTRRSLRYKKSHVQSVQRVSQQEEAEKLLRESEDNLRQQLEAITVRHRFVVHKV